MPVPGITIEVYRRARPLTGGPVYDLLIAGVIRQIYVFFAELIERSELDRVGRIVFNSRR